MRPPQEWCTRICIFKQAGVPRGLKAKKNSYKAAHVFDVLEQSAAADPLCSPEAQIFFTKALARLLPRDQILGKLSAREQRPR